MEKEQISGFPAGSEQVDQTALKAEFNAESDKKTENSFGKFSSADELLKAYNTLESEFTRRSQRLKEYEKAYGNGGTSIEEQKRELTRKYPVSEEMIEEATRVAETDGTDKNVRDALIGVLAEKIRTPDEMAADERVIDKVLSEEKNREAVINAYIEKIKKMDAPVTLPKGGAIPTLPARKATTVREAGEIARAIFEKLQK